MGIGPNKELIEPNFIMGGETKYVGLAYREGSKKNFVLCGSDVNALLLDLSPWLPPPSKMAPHQGGSKRRGGIYGGGSIGRGRGGVRVRFGLG